MATLRGQSPAAVKQAAKAAANAKAERDTEVDRVERVVKLFVERHAKPKTGDWRETERMLNREVATRWKGKRLSQITRANVHDMLDEIIDRGAPVRANRVFAQFRKLCRWTIARGIIDRSPCEGITAPSVEKPRDRVLSDEEIRLAWRAFESAGWPFGPIGQLLFLTGARRDEIAGMKWREFDLNARVWSLPPERWKNRRVHTIPLSDAALRIIESLPRVGDGKDGFIFTTTGTSPVSGFSRFETAVDRTMLQLAREEAEALGGDPDVTVLAPWILHDIRRTTATGLQKLGVRLEVTEAVLGHVSGARAGIVGVYQRHDYADEKRAALGAWARRLDQIVCNGEPSNVVELSASRK